MAQLTSEERIARVEMAPIEVQHMVAKAFLRDDIDDEDVQYLFNTDPQEEQDDMEDIISIENVNEEEQEGIGASGFSMRTTKPKNNKNFIKAGTGGWNTCILGKPKDPEANVLANCVGYASGRFNEIINEARNTTGCTYKTLNCNAENFPERAIPAGLKTGSTPKVGAIIVWQKGSLASKDGAGHVAVVERINADGSIYVSESGYNSYTFRNTTRSNKNGRWGQGSAYTFRCFIYLPDDVQKWVDGGESPITPNVDRDIYKDQIEVKISNLRVRKGAGTDKEVLGFAHIGYYNYYETAEASGYIWYRIADEQWIASSDEWTTIYPAQPQPTPKYNIGDKVIINGQLYGTADGKYPGKTAHNKVTNITRIAWGHPYPYNTTGDLGWMAEDSISPYVDPEPTPTPVPPKPEELKVGDKVQIIGTGNGSCYGDCNTAYGIGWTRQILKIWNGKPYPYQVGNNTGTTGFYQADALKKL